MTDVSFCTIVVHVKLLLLWWEMLIMAWYLMHDRSTRERMAKVAHAVLVSVDLKFSRCGTYGDIYFSAGEYPN